MHEGNLTWGQFFQYLQERSEFYHSEIETAKRNFQAGGGKEGIEFWRKKMIDLAKDQSQRCTSRVDAYIQYVGAIVYEAKAIWKEKWLQMTLEWALENAPLCTSAPTALSHYKESDGCAEASKIWEMKWKELAEEDILKCNDDLIAYGECCGNLTNYERDFWRKRWLELCRKNSLACHDVDIAYARMSRMSAFGPNEGSNIWKERWIELKAE